jgi:hypothetical protein
MEVKLHALLALVLIGGEWSASHFGCFISRGKSVVPIGLMVPEAYHFLESKEQLVYFR